MTKTKFVTLRSTIWVLDATIGGSRRRALLSPPSFEDIVAGLCKAASVTAVTSQPQETWTGVAPPPRRVTVTLEINGDERWVDLFHNAASGVRAQCLHDVTAESLALSSTKVWIHQGLWVRRARKADRHLRIKHWEAQEPTANSKKVRSLLRYGSKAPSEPSAIDVIGGFVGPGASTGKPPDTRPYHVHMYGFT